MTLHSPPLVFLMFTGCDDLSRVQTHLGQAIGPVYDNPQPNRCRTWRRGTYHYKSNLSCSHSHPYQHTTQIEISQYRQS